MTAIIETNEKNRAKWIMDYDGGGYENIKCSVCGESPHWVNTEMAIAPPYCPNCGSKMMNADDPYTYGDYVRSLSNHEIAVWAVDSFLCERCVHAYGSMAFAKCDARQRKRCLDDVRLFLDMEVEE